MTITNIITGEKMKRRELDVLAKAYFAGKITKQQFLTLRGQWLSGNKDAALKGLARLIEDKEKDNDAETD